MARGKTPRSRAVQRIGKLAPVRTGDVKVDRAQDAMVTKVNQLVAHPLAEGVRLDVELQPGLNKVQHGTGRPVRQFLWSTDGDSVVVSNRQADNPHPTRELWVFNGGVAPVKAFLVVI